MNKKEMRGKNAAELKQELDSLLRAHFALRMQVATQQSRTTGYKYRFLSHHCAPLIIYYLSTPITTSFPLSPFDAALTVKLPDAPG